MKALFELFRRFDARRIFGFIRRLGGMSRPKVKCYDLRSTHALRVEGDLFPVARKDAFHISIHALRVEGDAVTDPLEDIPTVHLPLGTQNEVPVTAYIRLSRNKQGAWQTN